MRKLKGSNQHQNKHWLKPDAIQSIIQVILFLIILTLGSLVVKYRLRISYLMWRNANVIAPCGNYCEPDYVPIVKAEEEDNEPTLENITAYIIKVFGQSGRKVATRALACFISESGLRHDAYHFNTNNTADVGVAQINDIHGLTVKERKDFKKNIDKAYQIYLGRKNFSAWYGMYCN